MQYYAASGIMGALFKKDWLLFTGLYFLSPLVPPSFFSFLPSSLLFQQIFN